MGGPYPLCGGRSPVSASARRSRRDDDAVRVDRGSAVLFPGQGVSVASSLARVGRTLPTLLERAGELIGDDCFARANDSTRFAQPAIFLSSLAAFTALAAAGALDWDDALELVVLRGRLMDESGRSSGDGSMLALLRSTPEVAAEVAAAAGVWVANDNAPGQTVLAGPRDGLRRASEIGRERGARTLALDVTGAFHSPWMAGAQKPFRDALEQVEFRTPSVTVFSGLTCAPFVDVRDELAGALT